MKNTLQNRPHTLRRRVDRRGQGVVEWGLMVSLVAVLTAAILSTMGQRVSGMLSAINSAGFSSGSQGSQGEILGSGSSGGVGGRGGTQPG